MLKQFVIDESYITDTSVRSEFFFLDNPDKVTEEDFIGILKGRQRVVTTSTKDHEEFSKLRDQLETLGFIKTERNYWNGDQVLKSFKLNEWTFKKGQKFPCASALRNSIECARQHGWNSLSTF